MPKRVIDFDAMWGSDKLAACAAWAQAEYAWLYGLADASGCFELTNLRVIWGRVAAIRENLTIERLEQVFAEFQDKGLLFVWEHEGKRYAHWTGSDVPGRLPPPSWRMRLEKFAPPVPKQQLAEYMARFARGRAALAGAAFRGEAQLESSNRREDCGFENSILKEERPQTVRAGSSQWSEPRLPAADRGEDCRFEISHLIDRGEHAGSSQRSEQRAVVTNRGDDRRLDMAHLKENGEPGERFGNSYLRERQATAGVAARDEMAEESRQFAGRSGLKERLEVAQAQDLDLDENLNENWEAGRNLRRGGAGDAQVCSGDRNREKDLTQTDFLNSQSNASSKSNANASSNSQSHLSLNANLNPNLNVTSCADLNSRSKLQVEMDSQSESRLGSGGSSRGISAGQSADRAPHHAADHAPDRVLDGKDVSRAEVRAGRGPVQSAAPFASREKELAVARELRVGQGPVCGPARVRPEILERVRRRDAARAGSRSP